MRIILVEDDELLADGIRTGLRQDGYSVDWFGDGNHAAQALQTDQFDLMVLDLGLPGKDGMQLLSQLRQEHRSLPVLILTARDSLEDRVAGLDAGADDYMIKPFDLEELNARVRALIRRDRGRSSTELVYGDLVLDPAAHTAAWQGTRLELTPKEYSLLYTLMDQSGKVVSRTRLQESIYGWDEDVDSNALEVHIHHLRKKLASKLIHTVRGVGYILKIAE